MGAQGTGRHSVYAGTDIFFMRTRNEFARNVVFLTRTTRRAGPFPASYDSRSGWRGKAGCPPPANTRRLGA